ncbi:MAG: dNTP triphosphohydrolase [Deltaproteobacteria bacterium]|nr:dNTP triphosphohydrolase [Deltaproteobacteria bacterium]
MLHCPSFRRLQSKAQVFSLDGGSFVRNRLTHSLEVAHNGIEIARRVTDKLLDRQFISLDVANAIISKTEIACLVHDIGNPPFGHFGEAAIRSWFKTYGKPNALNALNAPENHELSDDKIDAILHDFVHFDGNPQGFRILTRLASSDFRTAYGLNLTASQLLSCIKYPRRTIQPLPENLAFSALNVTSTRTAVENRTVHWSAPPDCIPDGFSR